MTTASAHTPHSSHSSHSTPKSRLVISWLLVGIPLAYGVYETLLKASKLFTG
ncbi:hypothetical protein LZC95_10430 [Pendulispora brunnea]|uniref:Uncharacterized protein n=1 Tax=Pendulispora brunnea TaxID=2905690 RepID=A0ABZ2KLL5_9BACT